MKLSKIAVAIILGVLFFCSSGCFVDVIKCHDKVVRDAVTRFRFPKEMNSFFGATNIDHFISNFGSPNHIATWDSTTFFAGRYRLSLQVPILIDYKKCSFIGAAGKAVVYIHEVTGIEFSKSGLAGAIEDGQWILTQDDWDTFVRSKGDWAKVKVPILTNAPVKDFDKFVKQIRKDFSRTDYQ